MADLQGEVVAPPVVNEVKMNEKHAKELNDIAIQERLIARGTIKPTEGLPLRTREQIAAERTQLGLKADIPTASQGARPEEMRQPSLDYVAPELKDQVKKFFQEASEGLSWLGLDKRTAEGCLQDLSALDKDVAALRLPSEKNARIRQEQEVLRRSHGDLTGADPKIKKDAEEKTAEMKKVVNDFINNNETSHPGLRARLERSGALHSSGVLSALYWHAKRESARK